MKYIWDKRKKAFVPASDYIPTRVHLISDFDSPIESPITGEAIHSKGQYQAHLREFGHHVSEPGDVAARPGPDRAGIREAVRSSLRDMGVVG